MVPGVTWCVQCDELEAGGINRAIGLYSYDSLGGSGYGPAPQLVHPILVDPFGAGQQFAGVDQVSGAVGVDEYGGALLSPPSGRTGMVEVDVGDQDVPDIAGLDPVLPESSEKCGQGRGRAGLHQHRPPGS
jgi:hypothetical protein